MNTVVLIMIVFWAIFAFLRCLRWVALVQQKEYRWDRITVFLRSSAGRAELMRVLPFGEWSRSQFRRPRLTARALVTLVCVCGGVAVLAFLVNSLLTAQPAVLIGSLIVVYVSIPLITAVIAVPTTVFSDWYSQQLLMKAGRLVREQNGQIIGITGSFGKTSTKQLLAHALSKRFTVFSTPRSFNTRLSVAQSVLAHYTGQELLVIEYGAYKQGEIAAIAAELQPSCAVLTGFAPQHLGLFGTVEQIKLAKQELVTALPNESSICLSNDSATELLPDQFRPDLQRLYANTQPITGRVGRTGVLKLQYAQRTVATELLGLHYLETVQTVWAVARQYGLTPGEILDRLATFKPSSAFISQVQLTTGARCILDGGSSNPAGFTAALALLKTTGTAQQHRIVVSPGIVDLGSESDTIHRRLAEEVVAIGSEFWHVGADGASPFFEVLGSAYLSEQERIAQRLAATTAETVILIEGRMPSWFEKLLAVYTSESAEGLQ